MQKTSGLTIALLLCLGVMAIVWLRSGNPPMATSGWTRGHSSGTLSLPPGTRGEQWIPVLEKEGFKRVPGKTFDALVPQASAAGMEAGVAVFRDTSAPPPNELYLGIGSANFIRYHETHHTSTSTSDAWKDHVTKRVELIERLTTDPP